MEAPPTHKFKLKNVHLTCIFIFQKTNLLIRELTDCIPNSEAKWRRGAYLKKVVVEAIERGYTDIISIEEHRKTPSKKIL